MGLIAIVTGSSYVFVCLLPERCAGMPVVAELCPLTIVHQQNTDIVPHVAVTYHVHIIEESQIAGYAKKQLVGMNQRSPYK